MNVYLVEDCHNEPGRILGVFAEKEAADQLADALPTAAIVEERTLIYGQAQVLGYNP